MINWDEIAEESLLGVSYHKPTKRIKSTRHLLYCPNHAKQTYKDIIGYERCIACDKVI